MLFRREVFVINENLTETFTLANFYLRYDYRTLTELYWGLTL